MNVILVHVVNFASSDTRVGGLTGSHGSGEPGLSAASVRAGKLSFVSWIRYLTLALAVVTVGAGCSNGPDLDIEVQHRTSTPAAKPLSATGPPAGAYEREWRTQISYENGAPTYHLIDGQLVLVTDEGFDAYDARTGKPSWRYREPGRQIDGFAATDGALVAGFRAAGDAITERHTVGLDTGTGELLWENTEEDWDLTYDGSGSLSTPTQPADAAAGIVVLGRDSDKERLGIQARTGDERWTVHQDDFADADCAPAKGSADRRNAGGDVVPFHFTCENPDFAGGTVQQLLAVLDAESGELLWSRRADTGNGVPRIRSEGPVTLLVPAGGQTPELIGRDGETLFAPAAECRSDCELYTTGGLAILRYRTAADGDMLASVDPGTGKTRTMRVRPPEPDRDSFHPADGRLYWSSLVHGDGLLPAELAVADVAGNRIERTPLPFPSPVTVQGAGGETGIAVGGERLFTVRTTAGSDANDGPYDAVLASYVSAGTDRPVELGGVAPEDWPDPCDLVATPPDPSYDSDRPPDPGEPLELGAVTIPRVSCGRYLMTVQVGWVAKTEPEAAELFPGGRSSKVGADEERRIDDPTWMYRVGRVIVFVRTYEDREAAAERVIANLRAQLDGS